MAKKKKAGNFFVYGILILIMAGLGGLGATNFGGGSTAVATVGDSEIDVQDYARAIDRQIRLFQEQTGQRLTFAQAQGIGLDRQALGQLVRGAAIADETEQLGLSVGDEAVRARIIDVPAFQGANGFDRTAYEFALRENGLTVREFEEDIRQEAATNLLSAAVSSGLDTPDAYIDTLYDFARETRDVGWLRLTAADLEAEVPAPTEDALVAFHAENAATYVQPEARVIDFAVVLPEDIAGELEVSDEQARALYEARLADFVQPERRLVERLAFASDEAAAEALSRIEAGEITFDELVTSRGIALSDIDLGEVDRRALGQAGDVVFALDEPGIAGPAPSSLGPALYRVNAILSAREVPFEEVRDELADEAALDRARRVITEIGVRVEDLLAGGAGVENIAEATEMTAGRIEYDGTSDEGLAAYAAFRDAADALEAGALPEPVELEDGGLAVLSLAEIIPPRELSFEEARALVEADVIRRDTETALRSRAETLAGTLAEGAAEEALTPIRNLTRDGFVEVTPPDFVDVAFEMEPGETRVLSAEGDVWLLRLDAINAADRDSADARLAIDRFRDQSTRTLANDVVSAFTRAIMAERPVQVNQSALNAVHSQLQ